MIACLIIFVASFIWTIIIITSMRADENVFVFISVGCMFVALLCFVGLLISFIHSTSPTTDASVSHTPMQAHTLSELVLVKPTSVSIDFENVQTLHIAESESSPHKLVVAYQSAPD